MQKQTKNLKKGLLSWLLCVSMAAGSLPASVQATETEANGLCEHHPAHTAECGYIEAVAGSKCTHQHDGNCIQITDTGCVHVHGENGCTYTPAQEAVYCGHVCSTESCGYVEAVAEVPCTCVPGEEDTLIHVAGCSYVAPVEGVPCGFVHENCGCIPAMEENGECNHVCSAEDGCLTEVLNCVHTEHTEECGYIAAVEGQECAFLLNGCQECKSADTKEDTVSVDTTVKSTASYGVLRSADGVYDAGNGFIITIPGNKVNHPFHNPAVDHQIKSLVIESSGMGSGSGIRRYVIRYGLTIFCDHPSYNKDLTLVETMNITDFDCTEEKNFMDSVGGTLEYKYYVSRPASSHTCTSTTTEANCKNPKTTTFSPCAVCGKIPEPVTEGEINPDNHVFWSKWKSNGDGTHSRTCGCGAIEKGNCGGTATCTAAAVCSVCTAEYGSALGHTLSHTNQEQDSVIEESCSRNCGHSETAALQIKAGADLTYNGGTAIEPLEIVYSDNWMGEKKQLDSSNTIYSNHTNAGTATGTFTYKDGVSAIKTFTIEKKVPQVSDFHITVPKNCSYDGSIKSAEAAPIEGIHGMGNVTVHHYLEGVPADPVQAGIYTVKIEVAEGDNYTQAELADESWTFEISEIAPEYTAPVAEKNLIYKGEKQPLVKAGDVSGGKFLYKAVLKGDDTEITQDMMTTELPEAQNAGTYLVYWMIKGDKNYTDSVIQSMEVTIDKATPDIGEVTASIPANNTELSEISFERTKWEIPGNWDLVDKEQKLSWGNNTVKYTFTPQDVENYDVVSGEVTVRVTDTIAPKGSVSIEDKRIWKKWIDEITFELLLNENVEIAVTAEDDFSGIEDISYIESDQIFTSETIKTAAGWTTLGDGKRISVTAEDGKKFIYYIRITDKEGNVTFLSTDGAVFDTQPPLIEGIVDGDTYYTTQKFNVSDANIFMFAIAYGDLENPGEIIDVKDGQGVLDGKLPGNTEAKYLVGAEDMAGNMVIYHVTMKPISTLTDSIKDINEENVTGDDSEIISKVESALKETESGDMTEEEKAALVAAQEKVDALQKIIEDTAVEVNALESVVAGYDKDSVKSTDESDVTRLITDLTEKLIDPNLTEDQKADLTEALETAQKLAEQIRADQTALEGALANQKETTSENYTVADKEDLEAAAEVLKELVKEENQNYTAEEKAAAQKELDRINSLIESIKRMEVANLYEGAVDFRIIRGMDGVYTRGTSKGLEFTANGAFALFAGVRVDGEMVDAGDYTAAAGSTVITLKADYLKTLNNGAHSFEVLYDVKGKTYSADCMFTVKKADVETSTTETETTSKEADTQTDAEAVDTGDDTNVVVWISIMLAAVLMFVLIWKNKKEKV